MGGINLGDLMGVALSECRQKECRQKILVRQPALKFMDKSHDAFVARRGFDHPNQLLNICIETHLTGVNPSVGGRGSA
jgi:hypothetical protein